MYWLPFEAMLKKFWTWEPEMSVQILVLDSTFGIGLIDQAEFQEPESHHLVAGCFARAPRNDGIKKCYSQLT